MGFSRQEYWSGLPVPSPFLALQPTKFFFSHISFLIDAKCSLSCKDKQNISKSKCHWGRQMSSFRTLCIVFGPKPLLCRVTWWGKGRPRLSLQLTLLWLSTRWEVFFFSFLPADLRVGLKYSHLPLTQRHSTSIVWGCFSAPTPQAIFSVEEEGKKFCWKQSNPDQFPVA